MISPAPRRRPRAPVDQQQIDRDDLRLQLRDCVDDPGDLRARQRIGAAMLHDAVVNRDDRHEVGRRLHAAGEGAQIGQCRLDPVEQAQTAVRMAKADRDGPQPRAEQRNQNIEDADCSFVFHVFYCPSRAIRAATRAGGQRLTTSSPDASTSTPSPGPR